jgi:hypothetical protein
MLELSRWFNILGDLGYLFLGAFSEKLLSLTIAQIIKYALEEDSFYLKEDVHWPGKFMGENTPS